MSLEKRNSRMKNRWGSAHRTALAGLCAVLVFGAPGLGFAAEADDGVHEANPAPRGSVLGEWTQDQAGNWFFESDGHTYAGEWACIYNPGGEDGQGDSAWFLFGEDGAMRTGWYQDPTDEGWYHLHTDPDEPLGRMDTGWHEIEGSRYYFWPNGRMVTGWNWIDGRCYYMDPGSGKMLADAETPDGYTVDESGAWTVKGVVRVLGAK